MSSGEAELYALVRGATQTKGLMAMAKDYDLKLEGRLHTDATAAIGMAFRRGLGKTRHIDVQYLWIQEEVDKGGLSVHKVPTKQNPADMFTKPVPADTTTHHTTQLGITLDATRAKTAPMLQRVAPVRHRREERRCRGEVSGAPCV
eukprot:7397409-Lingulodinium_polyedra.AAC.1